MKARLQKFILLLVLFASCSIEPLTSETASGNTVSSIKTVTRDIASKAVPTFPVELPDTYFHFASTGQTFFNQTLGPFNHSINPEGLSMRVSNTNEVSTYSEELILEGYGDWENGDPEIVLNTPQARVLVWKQYMFGIAPTVRIGEIVIPIPEKEGRWECYLLPGTYYFEIGNFGKLVDVGEAGTETAFYREASAGGTVIVDQTVFTERTLIRTN